MLHLIFSPESLEACLGRSAPHDALLLLGNAVSAARDDSAQAIAVRTALASHEVSVLQADLEASRMGRPS